MDDRTIIDTTCLTNYTGPKVDLLAYFERNMNLKREQDNKIAYWTKFVEVFNA